MPVVASYPAQVAQFDPKVDLTDVVYAAHINALQAEVAAIEAVLGILPQGSAPTVKERISDAEAAILGVSNAYKTGQYSGQRTATQTIPYGTWTDYIPNSTQFYRSDYDAGGNVFVDPSLGRIYAVHTGAYWVQSRATFAVNNTGLRGIRVLTSTGLIVDYNMVDASLTGTDFVSAIAHTHLNTNTAYYLRVQVFHTAKNSSNAPVSLNVLPNANGSPSSISATLLPAG